MEYGYIYKTVDLRNGMNYIGQRKGEFNCSYYGSGKLIKPEIKKSGKENFILELIAYADDKEETDILESYYIKKYDCIYPKGYNLLLYPHKGMLGKKQSEHFFNVMIGDGNPAKRLEVREKIRLLMKGKPKSPQHIENLCLSHIGKKHSEETKNKQSIAKLGKKNSLEHCRNIGLSKQGTHHSKEAKQKNRLAHLGKKYSQETQEKKRLAMKLYWANKKEIKNG